MPLTIDSMTRQNTDEYTCVGMPRYSEKSERTGEPDCAGSLTRSTRLSRRRHHLREHKPVGITIAVPGARPRTATAAGDYEDLLREGLAGTDPDALVLGRKEDRRNIAARVISDAVILGDCPRIEQSRLRSTWLVRMLSMPVPPGVLLPAAGLLTGRTLGDLLPYLPPPTGAESVLRDGRWSA